MLKASGHTSLISTKTSTFVLFLSLLKMTSFEPNPQEEISKISQELMDFYTEINHLQELKEHL